MQVGQVLISGVLLGGVYALLTLGLSLIFGVMRLINFAQAAFMMLAMYATYFLWQQGWDPLLAIPVVALVGWGLGFGVHVAVLRRVTGRSENIDAQLILTWGLALMIEYGTQLLFGATPRTVVVPYGSKSWVVGGVLINTGRLITFVVAVLLACGLYYLLRYTRTGMAMRAVSDDWEMASLAGIRASRVESIAFGLGIAVSAIAGILLTVQLPVEPFIGRRFLIIMFVAVVLGGLGHVMAGVVGGFAVGLVESVSLFTLPASLSPIVVFVLFLIVLMVRPQGILGTKVRVV